MDSLTVFNVSIKSPSQIESALTLLDEALRRAPGQQIPRCQRYSGTYRPLKRYIAIDAEFKYVKRVKGAFEEGSSELIRRGESSEPIEALKGQNEPEQEGMGIDLREHGQTESLAGANNDEEVVKGQSYNMQIDGPDGITINQRHSSIAKRNEVLDVGKETDVDKVIDEKKDVSYEGYENHSDSCQGAEAEVDDYWSQQVHGKDFQGDRCQGSETHFDWDNSESSGIDWALQNGNQAEEEPNGALSDQKNEQKNSSRRARLMKSDLGEELCTVLTIAVDRHLVLSFYLLDMLQHPGLTTVSKVSSRMLSFECLICSI